MFSVGDSSVISCEGSTKYGSLIYVDFNKINRPCTCTLTPSFDGGLFVTTRNNFEHQCDTLVNIHNSFIFRCPVKFFSGQALPVQNNQSVNIKGEYVSALISGTFYHCLEFQQSGKLCKFISLSNRFFLKDHS